MAVSDTVDSVSFVDTSAEDIPPEVTEISDSLSDSLYVEEQTGDTVSVPYADTVFSIAYQRYLTAQALVRQAREQVDTALALLDTIPDDADTNVVANRDEMVIEFSRLVRQLVIMENRDGPSRDGEIPLQMNRYVEREIRSFQTVEREHFLRWYRRSGGYISCIQRLMREEGMPEQLAYLPFIESGFSSRALSSARALGLWQFIASTGYRYGLKRDRWVDQRMDFEHATRAAIGYLRDLHVLFGDWNTALAAYNCGEGRVLRTINRQRVDYLDDFWDLYTQLPVETARYVPRFHATLQVLKDPAKYGFTDLPEPDQPIAFDTVATDREMALRDIATRLGIASEDLEYLNPELRAKITPAYPYHLRVPVGMSQQTAQIIAEIPAARVPEAQAWDYVAHRVRRGETLGSITRRYRTTVAAVRQANRLPRSNIVRVGQVLRVPARGSGGGRAVASGRSTPSTDDSGSPTVHVVRSGDTLWSIAQQYDTTVTRLREYNNLNPGSNIHPGQRLIVSR